MTYTDIVEADPDSDERKHKIIALINRVIGEDAVDNFKQMLDFDGSDGKSEDKGGI